MVLYFYYVDIGGDCIANNPRPELQERAGTGEGTGEGAGTGVQAWVRYYSLFYLHLLLSSCTHNGLPTLYLQYIPGLFYVQISEHKALSHLRPKIVSEHKSEHKLHTHLVHSI